MLKESLRISRELGDLVGIADNISRFARSLAVEGRAETAVRLLSRWVARRMRRVRPCVPTSLRGTKRRLLSFGRNSTRMPLPRHGSKGGC